MLKRCQSTLIFGLGVIFFVPQGRSVDYNNCHHRVTIILVNVDGSGLIKSHPHRRSFIPSIINIVTEKTSTAEVIPYIYRCHNFIEMGN